MSNKNDNFLPMNTKLLPKLTHLQFYILNILQLSPRTKATVMEALKECGEERSSDSFNGLMGRLYKHGFVAIDIKKPGGPWYTITTKGVQHHNASVNFYVAKGAI